MFKTESMAAITDPKVPKIVYSRTSRKVMEGKIYIRQHVFDYIISGTSDVMFNGLIHRFKAGDIRFATRNRLSHFIKQPPENGEYRSVSICIDQHTLYELKGNYPDKTLLRKEYHYDNVFLLKPHKLFKNYLDSLLPYVESGADISEQLIRSKIKEAVIMFIEANPNLVDILFDFSEPGKIDLEGYMNEHFSFNGELEQFAYLTGRSLSTFKRDFQKIFQTTPNKWLLKKRLEAAYQMIKSQGVRPNEAYIESGFKDYSHFSFSFKKMFGYPPSVVRETYLK